MTVAEQKPEERALAIIDTSLANYKDEFTRLLGDAIPADSFMSVAYEAFRRSPDLLEIALHSPDSLMKALFDAAALKLRPDGVLGSAYIVPRRNRNTGRKEAYFQIGYRGLVELIMRSGHVSNVQSRIVYVNEPFRIVYGTDQRIEHEPLLDGGERGAVRGVYAVARMRDGNTVIDYMTFDQVNAIRERSPSKSGPWSTDYEEMARKTVVRRLAKALPMSVEVQHAVGLDDRGEEAVVATVAQPTAQAASLAGRIRQNIAAAEPPQIEEQQAEPKDVTPNADSSADQASASADQAKDAAPQDEPAAAAAPKKRTRKAAPKAEEPQEEPVLASDDAIEPSDDLPPTAEPPQDDAKKFGALAGSSESWHGVVWARGADTIAFRNDKADARWNGKLVAGDGDMQAFFDSLSEDRAYEVTIAGELELLPWERDGQSMPPYRQITVKGIEVGAETDVPR